MKEDKVRTCERCGRPAAAPKRPTEEVFGICSECAAELDEWMEGSPVLKWNKVNLRPITEEERAEQIALGADPDMLDGWINGLAPEDGQEVLILFKNGDITYDTAYQDEFGVYFDSGYEWDSVAAWAVPEPYVPDEKEEAEE